MHFLLIFELFLLCSVEALYLPFRLSNLNQVPILSSLSNTEDGYMTNPQFEDWMVTQANRSFGYILENIGGVLTTLDPKEVAYGLVVASPLKKHPDYFYTWTRDSALTIRSIIYNLGDSVLDKANTDYLRHVVERYLEVNYHLQRVPNRSGKFDDERRSGLGEPKFKTDGTPFEGDWGRPQSDGPGLRALTTILYLKYLKETGQSIKSDLLGNVTFVYNEVVKPDLEYVMANWKANLFDLWEEINASHFFNSLTQLRALEDGRALGEQVGESQDFLDALQASYGELRAYITDPATGYVRPALPYIVETPALLAEGKRLGLDAATLLAALHAHNFEYGGTDDIPFDVDDPHVLSTITAMVSDMKYRYPINHDRIRPRQNIGVALGRYPEDVYDGYGYSEGNPWFISTASAAEIVFKWINKIVTREEDIVITAFNREFFELLLDDLTEDAATDLVIPFGSERYRRVIIRMFNYSDLFLSVIQLHADSVNGEMLEQFNKYHGYMQGAIKLTWSYSSFYNCFRWRLKASHSLASVQALRAKL